jgi:hypothetical protein
VKKTAAILLIGILFFNWCGYRLLSAYMEKKTDLQFIAQLDNDNYDESELISIKVPAVHLSYYTNSKQFERVDGQMEIEGVKYNYVKRRFFNDSLELMCIPNHTATQLQSARDEFFKLVNDLQHNGQSKKTDPHPSSSKSPSIDYYTLNDPFQISNLYLTVARGSFEYSIVLPSSYATTAEQPPDRC